MLANSFYLINHSYAWFSPDATITLQIGLRFHEAYRSRRRTFSPSYCTFHEVSHVAGFLQHGNAGLPGSLLVHFVSPVGVRPSRTIGCATFLRSSVRLVPTQAPTQEPAQEPARWHVVRNVDLASFSSKSLMVLYKGLADRRKA